MRTRVVIPSAALLLLFASATRAAVAPGVDIPVPEPTAAASGYYHTGNVVWALRTALHLAIPAAVLFAGLSPRLRNLAGTFGRVGRWRGFTVAAYAAGWVWLVFLLTLPLEYYSGFVREHAFGLSNQSFGTWLGKEAIDTGIHSLLFGAFLVVPYWLLARSPRRWWVYSGAALLPYLFVVLLAWPVWVEPLLNDFGPVRDPAIAADVAELARNAGIEGAQVVEVRKSDDTNATNAYVTGLGSTKRIVLWDTLLQKLDRAQVRFVVGHEMGHYVLGHVRWAVVGIWAIFTAGFFLVHVTSRRLIARYGPRWGFTSLADVASLPLLVLLFNTAAFVASPVGLACSRWAEHEADRFALELTHDNRAGATGFAQSVHDDLGYPRPSPLIVWLRWSHPPLGDRIDFCNRYRPWETGQPLRYRRYFHGEADSHATPHASVGSTS